MFPDQLSCLSTQAALAEPGPGSKDGDGAADHDRPYALSRPRSLAPFPFTTREYARLLVLRSRVRDNLRTETVVLFSHPDYLLDLAKERQAEIRREFATEQLTIEDRSVPWIHRLAGLVARFASAVRRPDTVPEDATWPRLSDYPYS